MYHRRFDKYSHGNADAANKGKGEYRGRIRYGGRSDGVCSHKQSIFEEIICHTPIALIALTFSFLFLCFFTELLNFFESEKLFAGYGTFFHLFHYTHILFASATSCYMLLKTTISAYFFSAIVALIVPVIFCTLSDIILPSLGGYLLGHSIEYHFCFLNKTDFINLLIFVVFGVFLGLAVYKNRMVEKTIFSPMRGLHIMHVGLGSLASLFYIMSHLQISFSHDPGKLLAILFVSIIVPCSFSDIVIPHIVGSIFKKNAYEYRG